MSRRWGETSDNTPAPPPGVTRDWTHYWEIFSTDCFVLGSREQSKTWMPLRKVRCEPIIIEGKPCSFDCQLNLSIAFNIFPITLSISLFCDWHQKVSVIFTGRLLPREHCLNYRWELFKAIKYKSMRKDFKIAHYSSVTTKISFGKWNIWEL